MMRDTLVLSFDLIGTLINHKEGIINTLDPIFNDYLLDIEKEDIYRLYSEYEADIQPSEIQTFPGKLNEIMKRFSEDLKINLEANDIGILSSSIESWPIFDDTYEIVRDLKKQFRLALISDLEYDLILRLTESLNVNFDYIISGSESGYYKSDASLYSYALDKFALPSSAILHVAQNFQRDVLPCIKLGIQSIWLNRYAENLSHGEHKNPAIVISSLDELINLVMK